MACQEEIEALKQQLAASLGAAESSGGGGGRIAAPPAINLAPPQAVPGVDASRQASGQQRPSLPPPAAAAAPAATSEDQAVHGQAIQDISADHAVVATADSTGAAAPSAEQMGEVDTPAEISAAQEGLASLGRRGSDEGQTAGEAKADDHQQSEKRAEGTPPASFTQPAPEVVVQEKIVERVVVEEKVRFLSRASV